MTPSPHPDGVSVSGDEGRERLCRRLAFLERFYASQTGTGFADRDGPWSEATLFAEVRAVLQGASLLGDAGARAGALSDLKPSIPQGESTAAGENVWLIEDVWTTGPGTPLYVHRDYTLKAWTDELAKNHQRHIRGRADFVRTAPLWTNDPNDAMRFTSRDAANEWLVFQPHWLNNEQYQAREHMFPPPPAAGQDLSEVSGEARLVPREERNLFALVADMCDAARKVEREGGEYAMFNVDDYMARFRSKIMAGRPPPPTLPDLEAENARLRAQIADMQADVLEHWSGKVAISLEEAERLNALPDLEGVKALLRVLALQDDLSRKGGVGLPDNHDDYETVSIPRVWCRRAHAALQALEAKDV